MDAVRRGIARVHARLVDGSTALTCISHKAPARLLPLATPAAARRGAARCVLSSLGGGLLQGDAIAVEARVELGVRHGGHVARWRGDVHRWRAWLYM